jgi:hypothetical protein
VAQVLEFDPITETPPADTPSHRRIRTASKALAVLFAVIFAADCLFAAVLVAGFLTPYLGDHLLIGPKGMMLTAWFGPPPLHAQPLPAGYVAVSGLPLVQRLAHVAVGPLAILPGLMILWNLHRLFRLYGQGVVFSEANARLIKQIGLWLLANAVGPLLTTNLLAAMHMRIDQNWFHDDTIPKLVLGAVVYVIGMVMEVGRQIEEERGQFV